MIEIARRWSLEGTIYLIEDAAYRELRYYGEEVPSLYALDEDGDRVIHAGTFSKPYSPGIRVGWGILPRRLVEPLLAQKGNVDFGSPHFNQVLMSTVMEMGLFDRHVAAVRESYREKLDATLRGGPSGAETAGGPMGAADGRAVRLDAAAGVDRYGRRWSLVPAGGCRGGAVRARRVLLSAGGLSAAAEHAAVEFWSAIDRGDPPRRAIARPGDERTQGLGTSRHATRPMIDGTAETGAGRAGNGQGLAFFAQTALITTIPYG